MGTPICDFLTLTPQGLYCEPGQFHVDPWLPVERAVVTHAHSDHARGGCGGYLAVRACEPLLHTRLGRVSVEAVDYGRSITRHGVRVSLHPAGHILGSAQVRIEYRGQVCVVTGDYKRQADPTCEAYEPMRCHALVTESTFGLPIYRWESAAEIMQQVQAWWSGNQQDGKASVLFAYALGKSQRILASLDATQGPIVVHGAIWPLLRAYRDAGMHCPRCCASRTYRQVLRGRTLSCWLRHQRDSAWLKRFGSISTAMASGWMQIRGHRRRRAMDRGFVLSDHADWPALLQTIGESECEQVWATHGYAAELARYLREQGQRADVLETRFMGEALEEANGVEPGSGEDEDAEAVADPGDSDGDVHP